MPITIDMFIKAWRKIMLVMPIHTYFSNGFLVVGTSKNNFVVRKIKRRIITKLIIKPPSSLIAVKIKSVFLSAIPVSAKHFSQIVLPKNF